MIVGYRDLIEGGTQILVRVDGDHVDPDLVMKVGSGRAP